MPKVYPYDDAFSPPAPVLGLRVSSPLVPSPTVVRGLVDSGADMTALPGPVVVSLKLGQVDLVLASGFEGRLVERPAYAALVALEDAEPQIIRVISWDEDYALVGRDIINHWRVILDGPKGTLEVS